jgi:hypothetical protein
MVVQGALGWGIPTALLTVLFRWLFDEQFVFPGMAPTQIVVLLMGGLLWGYVMWHFFENRFVAYLGDSNHLE